MLGKRIRIGLLILFVLNLAATCEKYEIKDDEYCGDLGILGADCVTVVSARVRSLTKHEWDAQRFGWFCSSPETYANTKTLILSICANNDFCTFEQKKALKHMVQKMNVMVRKAKNIQKQTTSHD